MTKLEGKRAGHLTVIGVASRKIRINAAGKKIHVYRYAVVCDCGRKTTVGEKSISRGRASSACGECEFSRGYRKPHELYACWRDMIQRCTNPARPKYKNYGGRGITVCDRWRKSFTNFLEDMGERPEGTTLDRRDNNGNYEPSNCRWATPSMQQNNRRNNVKFRHDDEELTLQGWADRWGVDIRAILVAMKLRVPFGVIARYQTC